MLGKGFYGSFKLMKCFIPVLEAQKDGFTGPLSSENV